jgi:hypothetical protein
MQLADIEFLQDLAEEQHPRYGEVYRYIEFRE